MAFILWIIVFELVAIKLSIAVIESVLTCLMILLLRVMD